MSRITGLVLTKPRSWVAVGCLLSCAACASFSKSCTQFGASTFGSDWIVVQFAQDGHPFNCWKLHDAVVTHTEGGNVDWKDPALGHLVGITGWENRVQVSNGDFDSAAALLGVNLSQCGNGRYPK